MSTDEKENAISDESLLAIENGKTSSELNSMVKATSNEKLLNESIFEITDEDRYGIRLPEKKENDIQNLQISIILDPPRKGVSREIIDALNNIDCQINLIYISCNPATLSRDLSLLAEKYQVESVTPFDMFPNTRHLEIANE